jgi:phage terminase large subunit GpA-like protein
MIGAASIEAWKLRDRRPIWEWAHDNVTLPPVLTKTSAFSVEDSLHFCEPLDALRDDRVREINIMAPPRSGKSLIADLFIPWTIDNDPASVLHVFQDDAMAKSYAETRAMPVIKSVSAITELLQTNRHATRTKEIVFSNGLPYIVTGPALGKLQSRGFRVVIIDEPWLIAKDHAGRIAEAKARMGDFARQQRNKFLCISQGGTEGDDWAQQFALGSLHEWNVECCGCRKRFVPEWEGKRSDGTRWGICYDAVKTESGRRNIRAAMESIRYECPHCGHPHMDTPRVKQAWNVNGCYVAEDGGSAKRKSYHWCGLIIDPWADQVEEWIRAQDAYDDGNHQPLITFYQKRRASHYDADKAERVFELPSVELTSDKKYDLTFLTVDVQQDHFWAVIGGWSQAGDITVLWAGRLYGWQEIADMQRSHNIQDQCVFIDAGEGSRQAEIFSECARHGHTVGAMWKSWVALKGRDRNDGFRVEVRRGQYVYKPYSWPPAKGDPTIGLRADDPRRAELRGKYCPVVQWSNYTIKGLAKVRRDEMAAGSPRSQVIKAEWNDEFARQLHSERETTLEDKYGKRTKRWVRIGKRDNHLWDCLCMQLVAAAMAGILTAALPE